MECFKTAMSAEIEVEASCGVAWELIHRAEMFSTLFSTCFFAESMGKDPAAIGHKIKVTRLLPSKHCFQATYSIIRRDEENMEVQFYSEDLGGQGKTTASTTWKVTPIPDQPRRCILTMSYAIIPHSFILNAGRLLFAPLIKKIVKRTIKQDLKDFAYYCEQNPNKLEKWERAHYSKKVYCGSVASDTHATSVMTGIRSEEEDYDEMEDDDLSINHALDMTRSCSIPSY